MSSLTARWCQIYILFPAVPVGIEYVARLVFSAGQLGWFGTFPYVSMLVCMMAVAIFVRDEIAKFNIPDGDEIETAALRSFQWSMVWFFGVGIFGMVTITGLEVLINLHELVDYIVVLNTIRAVSIFFVGHFIFTVMKAQLRFKLKVGY